MTDTNRKLERSMTPLTVWALAVGCMIGWGAFVMPGDTFLLKAGPVGTAIAMLISAFMMTVISYNYNYMINKFPVAGGAFIYTKATYGNTHGFICAWFLSLAYLAIVPLNGMALALVSRSLMGDIFRVGFHYTSAGSEVYLGEILLGAAVLVFFGILSIRGVKFSGIFDTVLVIALILGVGVFLSASLFSEKSSFANLKPFFSPKNPKIGSILSIAAVAPWAFSGYETIPQAVEEFKFSHKKTQHIMASSIMVGAVVYIILNIATVMTIPEGYTDWTAYIKEAPSMTGVAALPTFYASYMLMGKAGLIFLGVSVMSAILSSIIGFYMATSRLLYSMSNEGVLPAWFGSIHQKYRTPANSIIFIMAVSLIALPLGRTALGWIVNLSAVGASIGFLYTSCAALKYSRQEKNRKVIFSSSLGLFFSTLFVILLIFPIPGFDCSLNLPSFICMMIWIALGAVFYLKRSRASL